MTKSKLFLLAVLVVFLLTLCGCTMPTIRDLRSISGVESASTEEATATDTEKTAVSDSGNNGIQTKPEEEVENLTLTDGELIIDDSVIPNETFRIQLIHKAFDGNRKVTQEQIDAVTELDISNQEITDLNGISFLKNLKTLNCSGNPLTSLSLEGLSNLENLNCSGCELVYLDLSPVPALQMLDCSNNELTTLSLDVCPVLESLDCSKNLLALLNLGENPALNHLNCTGNEITTIDVTATPRLKYFGSNSTLTTELGVTVIDSSGRSPAVTSDRQTAYAALNAEQGYYLALSSVDKTVGCCTAEYCDGTNHQDGLTYAQLVDFDGDGTFELYLSYVTGEGTDADHVCSIKEELWTWDGSNVNLSWTSEHSTDSFISFNRYFTWEGTQTCLSSVSCMEKDGGYLYIADCAKWNGSKIEVEEDSVFFATLISDDVSEQNSDSVSALRSDISIYDTYQSELGVWGKEALLESSPVFLFGTKSVSGAGRTISFTEDSRVVLEDGEFNQLYNGNDDTAFAKFQGLRTQCLYFGTHLSKIQQGQDRYFFLNDVNSLILSLATY